MSTKRGIRVLNSNVMQSKHRIENTTTTAGNAVALRPRWNAQHAHDHSMLHVTLLINGQVIIGVVPFALNWEHPQIRKRKLSFLYFTCLLDRFVLNWMF